MNGLLLYRCTLTGRAFIAGLIAASVMCWLSIDSANAMISGPIQPIVAPKDIDLAKAELGRELFHDRRFSKDGSISCASCHDLNRGGADGRKVSIGINGRAGKVNSPTVLNSGMNFRQFWDGRANSLEDQLDGPVHDFSELGTSWPEITQKLSADPSAVRRFNEIYGQGPSEITIKNALAEFQRSLVTPNSRFDAFLNGDTDALSDDEKRGFKLFKGYGCVACHQGVNIGGNMFQAFGVMNNYFEARGGVTEADLGRFRQTKNDRDKHVFKVPSLRNVALTAPYFHDGSAATLIEAVEVMFHYQLGRVAPEKDKADIVAFLNTLTGELQGRSLEEGR